MSNEEQPDNKHTHTKLEEAMEVKSLRRIISAYLNYSDAAEEDVKRYERSYRSLPTAHKAILSHYPFKCQQLRRKFIFIQNMLEAFDPPLDMSQDIVIYEHEELENVPKNCLSGERNFCSGQSASTSGRTCFSEGDQTKGYKESQSSASNDVEAVNNQAGLGSISESKGNVNLDPRDWLDPKFQLKVPLVDVDKVRCIIRNIVRDWASEGGKERDQCYTPILEELDRLFPNRSKDSPPCCLVPGAGLGRLTLEISCLGFISQGNEFSYYMMICSMFILNHTETVGEWTVHPWIHSNCNSLSDNDQLRVVSFPDIHPASAGITEGFSMCGGDFVEVYSDSNQEGAWDAVVTCFFLDTAHNIVEYIEIISRILKDGGVWINLGPLLYHFADAYGTEDEMSIELSLEDVMKVAFDYGFHLEHEKIVETTYTANPQAMMQNRYNAAFWTMTKKGMQSRTQPRPLRPQPEPQRCKYDGIFQFGDSISDTGNQILEPAGPRSPCAHNPYGQKLIGEPTGRCSNGRLMIDFIAQALGLPTPKPYLELGLPTPNPYLEPGEPAVSFNHGVNFAVAGSTSLNTSVLLQNGILSPVTNSSLLVQLDWFLAHYQNLCETAKNCETYNILKGSLFMVGETGGNDYNYAFLQGKSIEDATALVPLVVNNIRDVAKLRLEYPNVAIVYADYYQASNGFLPMLHNLDLKQSLF
ncbi:hypothetical protein IFM89_002617 [Coptis chinensis]|uniref:carnosine N-methyltransferase n=1 Tax=Coptis chinensis TaxID=261450 RepID=A0A835GVA2_9MAGN|nr:hypothetical protein IFM89_002617 [Coptis chinensis]